MTLNIRKRRLGLEQVEYLGFVVGKDGIGLGERKVGAIVDFPTPQNAHEARRFHGMASYFRRFVPKFAKLMSPIIDLFKKDQSFVWGEKQETAFRVIKEKLGSKPILAHYNANANRTELHTDASAEGLAAMLFQENDNGKLHLVYAISRRTSDVEKAYYSSKLKLLAIVWAMDRLRWLVIGLHFVVVTDCQALIFVNSLKTKNAQIIQWLGSIAEFDYEITHRKGERMQHVDALSRVLVEDCTETLDNAMMFNITVHKDEILMYQPIDENLSFKIKILEKSEKDRTRREKGNVQDYVLRNACSSTCYAEGTRD